MSGMDMDGMATGGMGGAMMNVTLFSSMTTPLYSTAWVPATTGAYVGTCIFLIVLAAVQRGLAAARAVAEQRWTDAERDRRLIVVKGRRGAGAADAAAEAAVAKTGTLVAANGETEDVRILKGLHHRAAPWRLSVDLPRAAMTLAVSGVGYLLMLAVMTMNVGYFLSVLGGVFLGELLAGRFGAAVEH